MIDGRQLADGSIAEGKLASAYTAEVIKRNGTVAFTGTVSLGSQRITNLQDPSGAQDAATKAYVDATFAGVPNKQAARAASTGNLTLSGTQTVDGVSLIANDRVLVKDQTTASENGIYIVASGAWSRSSDADVSSELLGALVFVSEGSVNGNSIYKQTADAPITVGTTAIVWVQVGAAATVYVPTWSNKNMSASTTTADNQVATATTLASTPGAGSYVRVFVNGVAYRLGNGVKTLDCYFSGDSGSTARAAGAIAAGDTLYWVGSVAGFQLASTDKIEFDYVV